MAYTFSPLSLIGYLKKTYCFLLITNVNMHYTLFTKLLKHDFNKVFDGLKKSCFQFSIIDFSRPGSRFSCVSLEEMGQEVISAAKNIVIRYFAFLF